MVCDPAATESERYAATEFQRLFKEMTGASRKFLIPLFEYFDSKNVTLRVGDVRKLRRG